MATENKKGNAATQAKRRYNEKNYDQLNIRIPKGDKERYKKLAESRGQSLAEMIREAIEKML